MPNGTITSTENTFGTVNGALSGTVAGTLTGSVGVPGPQGPTGTQGPVGPVGPAGSPGQGVPVGGTSGQFLQKTSGADYATDWVTVNLAAYAVKANNLSDLTNFSTARSNLGLGTMATATAADYSTTTVANGLYYPLTGNPSSFLTASALTGYATESWVTSGFATTARGQPASGTVGQVLTKNSGTNYDSSWQTLIPGDRYLTTSTTSNTIGNGAKTFTVGTGLSYTTQQDIVISFDASNHMHAVVTSYNSGTGALVVDVKSHTGSGTYTAWTVNVGGTTPLQSVEWGEILGTLGDQTDLAGALNSKLEVTDAASTYQTLSGMSAYLTTSAANSTFLTQSNAALTYQPLSGMTAYLAKSGNLSGLTDTSVARSNLGLGSLATVNDAPSDGSTYGRNNGAWVVAGGGGSFPADALTTNEVNAVANAEFTVFSIPASVSLTYGSGVLTFQDLPLSADGKQITFSSGSFFSISNLGTSWSIGLMTDSLDPGYPKYVEDLVSYVNGQSLSLTASWSGTTGTDTVDGLTTYTLTLDRSVVDIQSGDRLMIEQGLREYLTTNALSLSAAANTVLTYAGPDQNTIVAWAKPWQSEGYITSVPSTLGPTTFTGKVNTVASTGSSAGLRIPHAVAAPSSPVDGDMWTTTTGLFYRINGATVSPATLAGGTYTGKINTVASTTGTAGFRLPAGTAPTTPVDGDMWTVSGGLQVRLSGATRLAVFREFSTTYSAGVKQTVTHNASSAGLNITAVASDPTTPATGDVWHNSNTQHIVGFSQSMRGAMTAVRAMCQVNVSSGSPSPVHSFNLSSITDNGVGDFTINFTNALFDANFLMVGSTAGNAGNNGSVVTTTRSTGSCRVSTIWNGALADVTNFSVAILR
jgi:hypothetical protein